MHPPEPAPELKKLDYFVGTWTSHGDVQPGPAGPGGKMTMTERYSWMAGRFFLMIRSRFKIGASASWSGLAFIGYDAARNLYTYDEFNSMGEAQHSTGILDGDTWIWTGEQHLGGKITKTRFSVTPLSPASYTFRFETSPDGMNWTIVAQEKATKKKKSASSARRGPSRAAKRSKRASRPRPK
jgi:Protein of unknown function (DUF1579)